MRQETDTADLQLMLDGIKEIEGARVADMCRQVVLERQSKAEAIDDWNSIVDEAKQYLHPTAAADAEAQSNLAFRSHLCIKDLNE